MQIEMLKICIFYAKTYETHALHIAIRLNIGIFINASDIIIHLIEKMFYLHFVKTIAAHFSFDDCQNRHAFYAHLPHAHHG